MHNVLKVIGHDGLVRDQSSGAIISVDKSEYEKYIQRRNQQKSKDREITELKNEVSEIKQLLQGLLQRLNNQ